MLDLLVEKADMAVQADEGVNFENKIVLSIATRLLAESYMVAEIADPSFTGSITGDKTQALFQRFKRRGLGTVESRNTLDGGTPVILVKLARFIDADESFGLNWSATKVRPGGGHERFDQRLLRSELQSHRSHPHPTGIAGGQRLVVVVSRSKHFISCNKAHCRERSPCCVPCPINFVACYLQPLVNLGHARLLLWRVLLERRLLQFVSDRRIAIECVRPGALRHEEVRVGLRAFTTVGVFRAVALCAFDGFDSLLIGQRTRICGLLG